MSIRLFMKRIGLFCLFLGAMYHTFSSISNITIFEAIESMAMELESSQAKTQSFPERYLTLYQREWSLKSPDASYISSESVEAPKTLEEAIDFSQYPKKKVLATGYTAGKESTGKSEGHPEYGITYSGVKVKRDLYSTIAADLSVFPLGTILFIPNYGYGVVTDIGGAIKGNKIDLYFETVHDVYNEWGKKEVEVYVIQEGEGHITEEQLIALNETESLQVFREAFVNQE